MSGYQRYGNDVLADEPPKKKAAPQVPAERGLVVEDAATGWCGAVTSVEKIGGQYVVRLEDRKGRSKAFPLGPGFWVEGKAVTLTRPLAAAPPPPAATKGVTASGSRAVAGLTARTARASRIWVEGTHDAELVEKIWGHDLRVEGIVVEPLGGVDDLAAHVREFAPAPGRRLGVLVDHLVDGSKEARIARDAVAKLKGAEHVMITGHPYVDIWQAIKPDRVGLKEWPTIDRSIEWKVGILAHLGLPHRTVADKARGWKQLLARVNAYTDLEPALLAKVETLIDFVTLDPADT